MDCLGCDGSGGGAAGLVSTVISRDLAEVMGFQSCENSPGDSMLPGERTECLDLVVPERRTGLSSTCRLGPSTGDVRASDVCVCSMSRCSSDGEGCPERGSRASRLWVALRTNFSLSNGNEIDSGDGALVASVGVVSMQTTYSSYERTEWFDGVPPSELATLADPTDDDEQRNQQDGASDGNTGDCADGEAVSTRTAEDTTSDDA